MASARNFTPKGHEMAKQRLGALILAAEPDRRRENFEGARARGRVWPADLSLQVVRALRERFRLIQHSEAAIGAGDVFEKRGADLGFRCEFLIHTLSAAV